MPNNLDGHSWIQYRAATARERLTQWKPVRFLTGAARKGLSTRALKPAARARRGVPYTVWTIAAVVVCTAMGTTSSSASDPTVSPLATGNQKAKQETVLFADVTTAAGIDFVETIGDHEMTNIVESTGVGCGVLDYDGDGWMDIYLVNGHWKKGLSDPELDASERKKLAGVTDHLYRNRGDGTFEDVTVQAGLNRVGYGMGIISADYDGDGDPDLYVTNYGPNFLYRNNGDGTFSEVATRAGVGDPDFSVGAVFLDYNRDGRLDLYVGNYVTYDPDYRLYYAPDGFPGPLAYTGQQDRLFRGNADGSFTDVTKAAGLVIKPAGRAMGVAAVDSDNDGLLDLFVSNDAMENFLLHNKGDGTFENRAFGGGVAFGENGDATAAMGIDVVDYDGDGRLDLFVPDMMFCCLYRNVGKGSYEDVAVLSGIASAVGQYHSWGSVSADFNLDGAVDLFVSNGDVHHLEPHDNVVFLGNGRGRFVDVSESAGAWARDKRVSRGTAGADFDNDGDIDILVNNLNDRPTLLRNTTPHRGRHWLEVRLVGNGPNSDAIGAVVRIEAGGQSQMRQRLSAGSYLSHHDPRLHFGLKEHSIVDRVVVTWPDGSHKTIEQVPADQVLTIRQQSPAQEASR